MIDINSVLLTSFFFSVLIGIMQFGVCWFQKSVKGFRFLAIGSFLSSLYFLLKLKGGSTTFLTIFMADYIIFISLTFIYLGIKKFRGIKIEGGLLLIILFALFSVALPYFTYLSPDNVLRSFIEDIFFIAFYVMCISAINTKSDDYMKYVLKFISIPFIIGILVMIVIVFLKFIYPTSKGIINYDTLFFCKVIIIDFINVGLGFGLFLASSKNLETKMKILSLKDGVTGLDNSKAFNEHSARLVSYSKRNNKTFTLAIIDVDDMNNINTMFDFYVGNKVIREFSTFISGSLRSSDYVASLGGDRFGLLLPDTTKETAHEIAERLRIMIADYRFRHKNDLISMTVSIGLSTFQEDSGDLSTIRYYAEQALHKAKNIGKNIIVSYRK